MSIEELLSRIIKDTNKLLFEQEVSEKNALILWDNMVKRHRNNYTSSFRYLLESIKDIKPMIEDKQISRVIDIWEPTKLYNIDYESLKYKEPKQEDIVNINFEHIKLITFYGRRTTK